MELSKVHYEDDVSSTCPYCGVVTLSNEIERPEDMVVCAHLLYVAFGPNGYVFYAHPRLRRKGCAIARKGKTEDHLKVITGDACHVVIMHPSCAQALLHLTYVKTVSTKENRNEK